MKVLKAALVILLVLLTLQGCYAFKWKPANLTDNQLKELIKNDKPDEIKVSFWDLPWWIKLHYILTVILSILGIWKLLPFVITKVKSVLDNSRRRTILRCIFENPGISLKEIEEITKINRSTLRFHLVLLEKKKLIYSIKIGKYRLFFPYYSEAEYNQIYQVLKSKRKKQIIELLNKNSSLSIGDIAEKLGVCYHTAYRHIMDLKEIGMVAVNDGSVKLNGKPEHTPKS